MIKIFALVLGLALAGGAYGILRSLDSSKDISQSTATATRVLASAPHSGVVRVGIQAGHWKNDELPDELAHLRVAGTGTSADGIDEWQVNLTIAQAVQKILEQQGITVDLLPATVPVAYKADAFVAIHADGNDDTTVTGYKMAASQWDKTGDAQTLSNDIETAYAEAVPDMVESPVISDDMLQYYAFNQASFAHSIDVTTPGVIVETGFLTNPEDRLTIVDNPQQPAQGIAAGIMNYLKQKGLEK